MNAKKHQSSKLYPMFNFLKRKLNFFSIIFIFFIFFVLGIFLVKTNPDNITYAHAYTSLLTSCGSAIFNPSEELNTDCIFSAIEKEIKETGDIDKGIQIFMTARNNIDPFKNENEYPCHLMLHEIGDIVYYVLYSNTKNVLDINFPQETSRCGYGFFHGFMEHVIQNNSDPIFAQKTCEDLMYLLEKRMSRILDTCFHGAGQGFMLAQMDKIPQKNWNNFQIMTHDPILLCEQLSKLRYKKNCWSGIFHWVLFSDYGLHFSTEDVLNECAKLDIKEIQGVCYIWTTRILSFKNPEELLNFIKKIIQNTEVQQSAFYLNIAQMLDREKIPYEKMLALCEPMEDLFYKSCLNGIAKDLVVSETPEDLFKLCSGPTIRQRNAQELCYSVMFEKLSWIYTPESINAYLEKISH
ncbi:MAG: hypothetical protein HYT93_00010 [Parcubacteria group bacterium]|nr:hypothetical protein [Parcubacteria group bacterium]